MNCNRKMLFWPTQQVMENLAKQFGDIYTEENVMLSPTHSHSAPGGFHTYWMYQSVSLGFINETFTAMVDGIVLVSELSRVTYSGIMLLFLFGIVYYLRSSLPPSCLPVMISTQLSKRSPHYAWTISTLLSKRLPHSEWTISTQLCYRDLCRQLRKRFFVIFACHGYYSKLALCFYTTW